MQQAVPIILTHNTGLNRWTWRHSEQCSSPLYLIYNPNMFTVLRNLRHRVRHSLPSVPPLNRHFSQSCATNSRIHLHCFFSVLTWSIGPRSLLTCSLYSVWPNRAPSQNSTATCHCFYSTSSLRYPERLQIKLSSLHGRLTPFAIHGMPV